MSIPPSMPPLRPWQHVLNGCVIAWRFVAVVAAFALFGSVGILFLLVLWPLRNPPPHKAMQRQLLARRIVAASWRTLLGWLRLTGVISVRMEGFERLGRPGQLVLANHPSLLDVLFLVGYVPGINCVVKASLLGNPTMRAPILACGYVLNDVSADAAGLSGGHTYRSGRGHSPQSGGRIDRPSQRFRHHAGHRPDDAPRAGERGALV